MEFEVGRKAFIRLRDLRFVDVLSDIEMRTMHETALLNSNTEARYVYHRFADKQRSARASLGKNAKHSKIHFYEASVKTKLQRYLNRPPEPESLALHERIYTAKFELKSVFLYDIAHRAGFTR